MPESTIFDYRTKELHDKKNVMLNTKNADNTIDVVLVGAVPNKGDQVLLTIETTNGPEETAWSVVDSKPSPDEHNELVCHALLKLDGIIIED